MEDDENKDIFVDLKNFNCKKCGIFPKDLTIIIDGVIKPSCYKESQFFNYS